MKTLLQFAAALALLVLSVSAAVLTEDAHEFILHRDNELKAMFSDADLVTKHAYASLTALDGATQKASGVLDEVQGTAENLKITSAAETAYWNKTARETSLAARDMRQLIARTDRELNDHFLPDLDTQLQQTSTAAQFSFESFTKAGDALTFQLNDPELTQTFHGLNVTADSLASSAGHVDHMLAFADKQVTTPIGFWKNLFLHELLPAAGSVGSVAAGFVK